MERRFEVRQREILQEAEVQPQVSQGMLPRLKQFMAPFAARLRRSERR